MNDDAMTLLSAPGNIDGRYIEAARPKDMPTCSDDGDGDKVHALMPKVISIALAVTLPASAVAADSLSNMRAAVQDKTEAAGVTAEQVEFLAGRLNALGASAAEIEDAPVLKINESGQTYGIALLEPDLVAVTATNGKTGYAYREEIEDEPFEITSSSD